jgi:hypothetical protein
MSDNNEETFREFLEIIDKYEDSFFNISIYPNRVVTDQVNYPGVYYFEVYDMKLQKNTIQIKIFKNDCIKYYINYIKNSNKIIVYESKYNIIEFKQKLLFIQSMYLSKYAYLYRFQYQFHEYVHQYFYPIFKNK